MHRKVKQLAGFWAGKYDNIPAAFIKASCSHQRWCHSNHARNHQWMLLMCQGDRNLKIQKFATNSVSDALAQGGWAVLWPTGTSRRQCFPTTSHVMWSAMPRIRGASSKAGTDCAQDHWCCFMLQACGSPRVSLQTCARLHLATRAEEQCGQRCLQLASRGLKLCTDHFTTPRFACLRHYGLAGSAHGAAGSCSRLPPPAGISEDKAESGCP